STDKTERETERCKFDKIPKKKTNIWETNGSTPYWTNAGAAIDDVIIYVGIDGNPIPKIMEASIVKNKVKNSMSLPRTRIAVVIFKPNPVNEATPTIMPTIAQAIPTPSALRVPSSNA